MAAYLDHAAATPTDPQVVRAMLPFLTRTSGNPSSIHRQGRSARQAVEQARREIAGFIGASPEEIIFTSGGTESNNLAVLGGARAGRGNHIVITEAEHRSVLGPAGQLEREGFRVTRLPVDRFGRVDPGRLAEAITDGTVLVSVMHANNEVGTVQNIQEMAEAAAERGVLFHTDAVQSLGHISMNVRSLNVGMLSGSAHKLYGPKGAGFLFIRKGAAVVPLLRGGEQENGTRAGTQNVPALAGLGSAAVLASACMDRDASHLASLRARLISGIQALCGPVRVNGHPADVLPHILSITFPGVDAVTLLLRLDLEGFACSVGSACSFAEQGPSHVLRAMGLSSGEAKSTLRISPGRYTTQGEIDAFLEVLAAVVRDLRRDANPAGSAVPAARLSDQVPDNPQNRKPAPGRSQTEEEQNTDRRSQLGDRQSTSGHVSNQPPETTSTFRISRIDRKGGSSMEMEDSLVAEVPLSIILNGRELASIVCTPEDMVELAVGYLFTSGLIQSRKDIGDLRFDQDLMTVRIETGRDTKAPGIRLARVITPGCFSHTVSRAGGTKIESDLAVTPSRLSLLVRQAEERSVLYRSTGGVHSAALCIGSGILYFNEDVGRHNAVDKLLGRCVLEGTDPGDKVLVMSGRVSSAIMVKIVNSRIPVAVSRSAPTAESVDTARRFNVTLVGFARGSRMNVYSGTERIRGH